MNQSNIGPGPELGKEAEHDDAPVLTDIIIP